MRERTFIARQEWTRVGTMPYWDDRRALQQMWDFCAEFPQGTEEHSIAAWTQSWLRTRGKLPPAQLRAQLIKVARAAGWKPGVESVWDLEEVPEAFWG